MGHLFAVVVLVFFVLVLTGKIYLSYLWALRHPVAEDAGEMAVPESGLRFVVARGTAIFYNLLAVGILALFGGALLKSYRRGDAEGMVLFWFLFDVSIPAALIILAAALKGFRSYLHIYPDGMEYRDVFRVRRYAWADIAEVFVTRKFIFLRRKGRKLPVVIDNIYGDRMTAAGLLVGGVNGARVDNVSGNDDGVGEADGG